ncbi:MAG: right-handed parallel beta-helix repeat-containing protein [Oscillospiraceae bacterium]|nr:right-handed parallel beta-helix repeat-containing protein [Oscillospiraceae bacterium]
MNKSKNTRRALHTSLLSLLLCVSMLLGTTFAWFTDSVASTGNIIKSGTLDVEMSWSDTKDGTYKDASAGPIFDYKLWEPGFTQTKYIKVENKGDLAFQYQMRVIPNNMLADGTKLAEVIDVYCAIVDDGSTTDFAFTAPSRDTATNAMNYGSLVKLGTLKDLMLKANGVDDGVLLPEDGKGSTNIDLSAVAGEKYVGNVTVCLALHMQEEAGNEYQNLSIGDGFKVELLAAQMTYEMDSFDAKYDQTAAWPVTAAGGNSFNTAADSMKDKTNEEWFSFYVLDPNDPNAGENHKIATVTVDMDSIENKDLDTPVTLNIAATATDPNFTLSADQTSKTYEITANGLKEGNTTDVKVELGVAKGLTGVKLYHDYVEMDANKYSYNPTSGIITFHTATFSPFTIVFDAKPAEVEQPEDGKNLPVANVVKSPEYENTELPWGSYGQWSPTAGLDANLEAAYTFTCEDTAAEAAQSEYANWHCDFYVKLDKDLGENEIFLGGNYGSFGWVGFHNGDLTLEANTEIPLLGSVTTNPWTYDQVATNVGTFICGVGDVNDALVGATFTVMLRLTNPDDATEFYNVSTINHTFTKSAVEVTNTDGLADAAKVENAVVAVAGGEYKFPTTVAKGVTLVCADDTVFTGTSGLNINGATVVGATFKNDKTSATGTVNGTFKNCVFEGSEAIRWCYAKEGETAVFENCVIKTNFRGIHFDDIAGNVIFRNCEINGFNAFGGAGTVTFEKCKFGYDNSSYNGLNLYMNTNLINCEFVYENGKTNFIDMEGTGKTLSFTGCTATLDGNAVEVSTMVGGSMLTQNTVVYN